MPQRRSDVVAQGELGRRIASELGDLTREKVTVVGMRNAERNRARIAAGKSILALRDGPLMEGDTAVVLASGPSLHRRDVAAQLKRFPGTIVAAESTLAYCLRHGIRPDLLVTLDPHPDRIVRWFGDPALDEERVARDDYFARQEMDPQFAERQLKFNADLVRLVDTHARDLRIAVASSAAEAVVTRVHSAGMDVYWWNPFFDDYDKFDSLTRKLHASNGLPCLNAGGNVGAAAWVIAHAVLEKKRIALVGMDMSYYDDTPYEKTQYYNEIVGLVGQGRLDEVFVWIHNPYVGRDYFTDPAYLWYRDSFLEMAREADCTTYNCTEGGILFGPGVTFMPLETFLETAAG